MPAAENTLGALIRKRAEADRAALDPALGAWLSELKRRYGSSLLGVLLYGSYLRGKRDAPPDFYALVDRYSALPRWQAMLASLLPPNVYRLRVAAGREVRFAKLTTVRLDRFERGVRRDFQSYFWARFAQRSHLLYARDAAARARILSALEAAVRTFVSRILPRLEARFTARELWCFGLAQTYRCELRSESAARAEALYDADPVYFEDLTRALAGEPEAVLSRRGEGSYASASAPAGRRRAELAWWLRRAQGKLLSGARVCKAALTFTEPLDYLLWKIERHSGVRVTPTERQRRWPLLFAWPLLWRVYRRGGFK